MKLKTFVLLALALLAFSTPMLVTMNVSAPKLHSVSYGTIKSINFPVQPCGDPIEDPDFPH